jgi:hypothetical protein
LKLEEGIENLSALTLEAERPYYELNQMEELLAREY